MNINIIALACILVFLSGCEDEDNKSKVDEDVSAIVSAQNLTGDPSTGRNIPSINSPKAQLGMKLFFTKSLGGDKDSACVSCHHPALGGGDNLSLSIGVAAVNEDLLGPGRAHTAGAVDYDHGYATTGRNAPSTYNLALWDRGLFWDYRVESMDPTAGENADAGGISTPDSGFGNVDLNAGANLAAAQARFPVTSANEMRGFSFDAGESNSVVCVHLSQRLSDANATDYIANTWESEFETVYGANSVTFDNMVDAIGEYERSQLFVNSPWKAYVRGDVYAISLAAKRGAKLFFRAYEEGGMNCAACHSGDFFTDESFHVMAIPQVGRGKENGVSGDDDFGRANVSGSDKYAFRTPTLLNVEVTGPWGHSGAYTTLEAVVRHMVDVDSAVAGYDFSQLDSTVKTTNTAVNTANALAQLHSNRSSGLSPHRNVNATSGQISDLVAFLKTLTDPCVKERDCIGEWIPANTAGPDALQLNATDASGDFL